jgi:hypothetical protein
MRWRTNPSQPLPAMRIFRLTKQLAPLVLLMIGNASQAQSHGARSVGEQFDFNLEADLTPAATGGTDSKLPARVFPILPYSPFIDLCVTTTRCTEDGVLYAQSHSSLTASEVRGHKPDEGPKPQSVVVPRNSESDGNQGAYYKNRLEFSLDGGWLPINIPFVFDVFLGDSYNMTPLKYTLVPVIGSIRWQVDNVGGPRILRGNWDLECSGTVTFIPRGPETRYFAWILGFRRNFVPRRGRFAPYFDGRVGMGGIDAKEPAGVLYAQGQDFTFTLNMGSGIRYNFNSRYSISAGLNWMHISNLYLSQPQFSNYGINVYGPLFGAYVRLGNPRHHSSE